MSDLSQESEAGYQTADDNVIQPFQLEASALRGRIVRAGHALDEILTPHDYPDVVSQLVAETITLSLLLSSMLKYKGIFTLQTRGDGPIGMLVADVTSEGTVRGCATFDKERLEKAVAEEPESLQSRLEYYLGSGHIAFTVDHEGLENRYQGIVELKQSSLVDSVQHYFNQSEQIRTGIQMAVGKVGKKWRAGAIMLQNLPEDQKNLGALASDAREEDWRRTMILLETCTEQELLDPDLHSNALLMRLFHEEGVRVYDVIGVEKGCRCDASKVEAIIAGMPEEDIEYLTENGTIKMRCEFCSRDFVLDVKNLKLSAKSKTSDQ